MSISAQLAKHFRDVHFGGNWTTVDLKGVLADVTWEEATTKVRSFNTIAALTHHLHYYIGVVSRVLEGGPLEGKDELSWHTPPLPAAADWAVKQAQLFADATALAGLMEQLPDDRLLADFADPKYGSYYRNLAGITEHAHYHLGQVVVIKKLLREADA